jgi:hypothetical protein
MIRNIKNQEFFYLISCSDWEEIVLAKDEAEAASKALKLYLDVLKDKAVISYLLSVKKCSLDEEEIVLFSMSQILADIGLHNLALAQLKVKEKSSISNKK